MSEPDFKPEKFAVVGAGPVGCIVAAYLSAGGYDVTLCDVIPDLLKPAVDDSWYSPTEIGHRFGVSANRIGRTVGELGLRANLPGLSKAIINKAQGHNRTITTYLYSEKAIKQIEEHLLDHGYIED